MTTEPSDLEALDPETDRDRILALGRAKIARGEEPSEHELRLIILAARDKRCGAAEGQKASRKAKPGPLTLDGLLAKKQGGGK